MKALWPALRLLVVTALALGFIGMGLQVLAHLAGVVAPTKSPLPGADHAPLIFAAGDEDVAPPFSKKAFEATLSLGDRVVPVVEVRPTADRVWVVYGEGPLELWTNGQGSLERRTWDQVSQLKWKGESTGLLRLNDFLATFKPERLLVVVHSSEVAAAKSLMDVLGPREAPETTFIFSPNHRLNRELHHLRPLWWAGADAAELAQWHIFAALGIEELASADFDWMFGGTIFGLPRELAPGVWREIQRRMIGLIVPEGTPSEAPYGLLTKRPNQLSRSLERK